MKKRTARKGGFLLRMVIKLRNGTMYVETLFEPKKQPKKPDLASG